MVSGNSTPAQSRTKREGEDATAGARLRTRLGRLQSLPHQPYSRTKSCNLNPQTLTHGGPNGRLVGQSEMHVLGQHKRPHWPKTGLTWRGFRGPGRLPRVPNDSPLQSHGHIRHRAGRGQSAGNQALPAKALAPCPLARRSQQPMSPSVSASIMGVSNPTTQCNWEGLVRPGLMTCMRETGAQ